MVQGSGWQVRTATGDVRLRLTILVALGIAGCASRERFVCRSQAACDRGEGAFCQPSGGCSVSDPGCSSGHRYVEHAPAELASQCVPGDVVTGLVLHLPFDEGDGRFAADDSPTGAEGILVEGADWIDDGVVGTALHFDGVRGEVEIPGDSTIFGESSFGGFAWIRSRDTESLQKRIIGRGYQDGSIWFMNLGNGLPWLESRDAAGLPVNGSTRNVDVADGAWHHLGVVVDKDVGEVRMYVDGRLFPQDAVGPIGRYGDEGDPLPLLVGGQDGTVGTQLVGDADEVWVFARALADADVQVLYEGPAADIDP